MRRSILTSVAALLVTAGSMIGHHGYAEYDRNAPVTLEGTVKHIVWANPHVVLTLETETKGEYSIEWAAIFQLARTGITAVPVKEGDRLIITGSINRNPEKRILTIVQEMSRPADGWHWETPNRSNLTLRSR
jgi:hypothetical protein